MSVTWNPSDKDAGITLSNGNLSATAASWVGVRCNTSKSSGKWYYELTVSAGATGAICYVGWGTASAALNNVVGIDVYGWGWGNSTGPYKIHNASSTGYGTAPAATNIIQVAIDIGAGKLWFGMNGTWFGSPAGNPGAGTNESYSSVTGTLFPMVSPYLTGTVTANFGASAFAYSVPSGFSGLDAATASFTSESTASFSSTLHLLGTITEALTPTDWIVRTSRLDTGALLADTAVDTTSSGAYSASCGQYYGPVMATCYPKIGTRWAAATGAVLNDYVFPTNCQAKPYFFKATTAPTSISSLNPSDKSANITLSSGNSVAAIATSAWSSARGTLSKSTGTWYYTLTVTSGGNYMMIGLADGGASINNYAGATAKSLAYSSNNGGGTYYTSFSGATQSGTSFNVTTGDTVKLLWNADTGTVELFKNGASQGIKWTGVTGTLYPMVSVYGTMSVTADFTGWTALAVTGSSEPTWDTTTGNATVDNQVTWTCMGPLIQPITHSPVIPV